MRFAFYDFERTSYPYFTPKTPLKGLKMMGRLMSPKIIFQNLTRIFRFLGIPGDPKLFLFFRKRVHEKSNYVFISQYFLMKLVSYER